MMKLFRYFAPLLLALPLFSQTTPIVQVDTWAALKALPISVASGKMTALVKGRVSTNDGGGGTFTFTAGAGATDDGGTIAAPNVGTGAWFRQYNGAFSPMWFGAIRDGVTDDRAALVATFAACPAGGTIDFGAGTYAITATITLTKNVNLIGSAKLLSTTGHFILSSMKGFTVTGIDFETSYVGTLPPTAFASQSSNLSNIRIQNCTFGKLLITLADDSVDDGVAANTNIVITGNNFKGDYTGATAGDTCNVIDLRGWNNVIISDNVFTVTGEERVISVGGSSRQINIENNSITSFSNLGKQAIQTFLDGRDTVMSGNTFVLTGTWSAVMEGKSGFDTAIPPKLSEIAETLINGNQIDLSSSAATVDAIGWYGPWGLNATTSVTQANCTVAANVIKCNLTNSLEGVIQLRGFNSATVSGNTIERKNVSNSGQAIEVGNNKRAVVNNNMISYGGINVFGARNTPDGTTYTNSPQQVVITGNAIGAVNGLAAVYMVGVSNAASVTITGNAMQTTNNGACLALIYQDSTSVITNLQINANSGLSDVAYVSTVGTVNNYTHGGNSWEGNPASASGNLTVNTIPKATGTNTIGNSRLTDDGTTTTIPGSKLTINGAAYTMPGAVGAATTFLEDVAGNGTLSWATIGGTISGLTAGTIPIATSATAIGNSHWLGSATYLTPDGDGTIQAGSTTNRIAGLFVRPLNASSNTLSLYDSSGTIASVFGPAGGLTLGGQVPPGAGNLNLSGNVQSGGYLALGATASTPDVFLVRDGANSLGLRNGASAQTFKLYNTYTDASNNERFEIVAPSGAGGIIDIRTAFSGTGSIAGLRLGVGGAGKWNVDTSGNWVPQSDAAVAVGSASRRVNGITSTIYTANAGSISSDTPNVFSQQWNSGGVTFHGLKIVATNTASAAASELLQFLGGTAGTTEVASVRVDGQGSFVGLTGGASGVTSTGGFQAIIGGITHNFGWSSKIASINSDIALFQIGSSLDTSWSRSAAGESAFGTGPQGSTAGTVNTTSLKLQGKVTVGNGIVTAGMGTPFIYGANRATAQTAANTNVVTYTTPASDGSYLISANVLVTTSSAESFTVQVQYTDEGNTPRVQTLPFVGLAGTALTAIAFANGAVPYEGVAIQIRTKASTGIAIATTGTFTGCTYNVGGVITQLQ